MTATITLDIDPTLRIGPLSLAWHGLMIAVGIVVGAWLARRYAKEEGLNVERLLTVIFVLVLAGIVGSRALYLLQNDPGAFLRPSDWLGTRGFSLYGAVIAGTLAVTVYVRRARLTAHYLDALAVGFPLGLAVGRIGDVIAGEHYGPRTDVPWGFRYLNPHAEVPDSIHAYHSGGFYELLLGLAILAFIWPLRHRFRRPTMLLWTVIALYGLGRFVMFFYRNDTVGLGLGLNEAQAISIGLILVAAIGMAWARRRWPAPLGAPSAGGRPRTQPAP